MNSSKSLLRKVSALMFGFSLLAFALMATPMAKADSGRGRGGDDDRFESRVERRGDFVNHFDDDRFDRKFDHHFNKFDDSDHFGRFDRHSSRH